jgi:DNA polymerase-3 subunit delta'
MLQLSDIFGQDEAIDWIRKALAADHLPHGLIFAGPVGVGKGTTATALASLFLCENPTNNQSCGQCESCRVMMAGNHPDFHVITKELIRYHDKTGKSKGIDLSIHVVRPELIEPAGRKASMGRGKVFVVEQAELMNPQAQNALLKTLEEPAGRTLIILLTDQPNALLQTIRSRSQIVRFAALDDERVRSELQKHGLNKTQAANAAKYAEGSLGIALKWHNEGVIDAANELVAQLEAIQSGKPATDLAMWFKKAADAYAEKQLERDELASKDQATREGLGLYLRIASQYFRSQLGGETDSEELERRCAAIDAIVRAENYLDANVNIPLIFQQLAIALEMNFLQTSASLA